MNTYNTLTFNMRVGGLTVTIDAEVDDTGNVFDVVASNAGDDPIMDFYMKVRRTERNTGQVRHHDTRMVSSTVDWKEGTVKTTFELADAFLKVRDLAVAAARCLAQRANPLGSIKSINCMDREVIDEALSAAAA